MKQLPGFAFLFFLFSAPVNAQVTDSISQRKVRYSVNSSVSASYISLKNWRGEDHTSLNFLSNADLRHRVTTQSGWSHDHLLKAELGYLNYTDSLWVKSADQFKISMQWNEKPGKHLTHSYSVYLQSQFARSYRYSYATDGDLNKQLKGWFMAPGLLELAYGLNWRFWETCRINTAFATCRIRSLPRSNEMEDELHIIRTPRKIIRSEYGFSTQVFIMREFYDKHLIWEHTGRLFFNKLDARGIHADVNNRLVFKFLKLMQFRIDMHFIYDPDLSSRPSFRHEILLGLFYEIRK